MGKSYYRRSEMVNGGEFRCPNCNKVMLKHLKGSSYELSLECPRCKCEMHIRCHEPIPFVADALIKDREREKAEEAVSG